jgi:antitoxin (DNA-binding transcriptional repressor) of toxin-antitoxin stability system
MKIFNYSEARQNFAAILNTSLTEEVIITRRDGSRFRIVPIIEKNRKSPFEIEGVKSSVKTSEIISIVRKGREDSH